MLVVAGLQGSGKTYLLEKNLLPSKRYDNYVRLYLPEYRKKHPQYAEMIKLGVLHAYEHTEAFVREVSAKIFTQAFTGKYNIIMECAFDSIDFAAFTVGNSPGLSVRDPHRWLHPSVCSRVEHQKSAQKP